MTQAKHYLPGMLGRLYANQDCAAAHALELVGERWSLLILRDAMFRGYTRFSQFQKKLGIATNILSKRLDAFVAAGLMERRMSAGEPAEYLLTQKGLELKLVIVALTQWGDKWVEPGPILFANRADGRAVTLQLRQAEGEAKVALIDVVAQRRQTRPKTQQ